MSNSNRKHPLIEKVLSLLRIDPKYQNMGMPEIEVLYLRDEDLRIIQDEFETYFESEELVTAILSLLQLANALGDEGHEEVAVELIRIVTSGQKALEKLSKSKK